LGTIFRVTFTVFYRRIWNIVGKYSILCCDMWKVKNQYARAVRAPQCMHLVVLLKTLQRLVGPFGILQVLLRRYSRLQGCLVHGHFNKAPFRYCMPRTNDASVTWLGLNSFIVQTFHLLQLDQLASEKR
jgi:hypothetical protein